MFTVLCKSFLELRSGISARLKKHIDDLQVELLIAKPLLSGIKKIGHDLDEALAKGITSFVSLSRGFMCIIYSRHISNV